MMALQTEYEFTLPKGFVDEEGNIHKTGIMRLATGGDEIFSQNDLRVEKNHGYVIFILLSKVIIELGSLKGDEINPNITEKLFLEDLNYLQELYQRINGYKEVDTISPE